MWKSFSNKFWLLSVFLGVARPALCEDVSEIERQSRLQEYDVTVSLYLEAVEDFKAVFSVYDAHFKSLKKEEIDESYVDVADELETELKRRRENAVLKFRSFIEKYPYAEQYTPDAMFRLAELLFEQAQDIYREEHAAYDKAVDLWDPDGNEPEPVEPLFKYGSTIETLERLLTAFPDYRYIDGAYYLLGYVYGEQGHDEKSAHYYQTLLSVRPESAFVAEVWTRLGEYYFNTNQLQKALEAYTKVLSFEDSVFYDKALYKIAWTHYRLADAETAPEEYQKSVDAFVRLLEFNEATKKKGKERGADLRPEAIQYFAISYADEAWGGVDKLRAYFNTLGHTPYEREVYLALGDIYIDQTHFKDAVATYNQALSLDPLHETAPVIRQKMIAALERLQETEEVSRARVSLIADYAHDQAWFVANAHKSDALKQADDIVGKNLIKEAVFQHKQAQSLRALGKTEEAKPFYFAAAQYYGMFLERFPHDKDMYQWYMSLADALYYKGDYLASASYYKKVRSADVSLAVREEASLSTVLAYQEAMREEEKKGTLISLELLLKKDSGVERPKEIPYIHKEFASSADMCLRLIPSHEKMAQLLYKSAEIYYAYGNYQAARERFWWVIEHYPKTDIAKYAANLTIESFLVANDYAAVEKFTRRLLEKGPLPGDALFKEELVKFKSGAMFKLAESLLQQEKYEASAELFVKLVAESPSTEFLDSALNNAAVAYEKVKKFESASRLYERIVKERPDSPLADAALFRVGLNAERFFDFKKSIEAYQLLLKKYPKSEKASDALFNTALAYENFQEYDTSAQTYARYCSTYRDKEDSAEVCFRAALVYEKKKDWDKAIATYQNFIKLYASNEKEKVRVVQAYVSIAQAYRIRKKETEAYQYYQQTVQKFSQQSDPQVAYGVAEAQFRIVERDFQRFVEMKIDGDAKSQQKKLVDKAERLKAVSDAFMAILQYKQFDWTLASLLRIGQMYQNLSVSLMDAPCPSDVRKSAKEMDVSEEEVCDEYRVLLEEKAVTIEDKAVAALETTVNKSREYQVVNEWSQEALRALSLLRPAAWPLQKEAKTHADPRVWSSPTPWVVVNTAQPLETPSSSDAAPTPQDDSVKGQTP